MRRSGIPIGLRRQPPSRPGLNPGCPLPSDANVSPRGTHLVNSNQVKRFAWGTTKNRKLKAERGVGFEEIVVLVEAGGSLDILEHPNRERYGNQRIFVVRRGDIFCSSLSWRTMRSFSSRPSSRAVR